MDEQKAALEYKEGGVFITGVIAGHPASQAGLREGDMISAVHSIPVHEISEFLMALNDLEAGRKYPFRILRRAGKGTEMLEVNILVEKIQERKMGKIC
jgi:S1-C subfamily serine protease